MRTHIARKQYLYRRRFYCFKIFFYRTSVYNIQNTLQYYIGIFNGKHSVFRFTCIDNIYKKCIITYYYIQNDDGIGTETSGRALTTETKIYRNPMKHNTSFFLIISLVHRRIPTNYTSTMTFCIRGLNLSCIANTKLLSALVSAEPAHTIFFLITYSNYLYAHIVRTRCPTIRLGTSKLMFLRF